MRALSLTSFLACSNQEDSGAPIVDIRITPPPASKSLADVESEIKAVLARGVPNPFDARAEYMSALQAGRDNSCPGQGYSVVTSFSGCNTSTGWFFAGYTEYIGGNDQAVREPFYLLADFRFRDSQQNWFVGGGQLRYEPLESGSWSGSITGTWAYNNGQPWMQGEGAGAVLTASVTQGTSWSINIDGSINAGGEYLRLREVSLSESRCNGDVSGELEVRSADGYWYTLDISCGCGQLYYADEAIESGCVELSESFQVILDD